MEKYCEQCKIKHESAKWYLTSEGKDLCAKMYLQEYHKKRKEKVNADRREKYTTDEIYRKTIQKRNQQYHKERLENGYKRIRKPRSEWTESEREKELIRKRRHREKHKDAIRQYHKEYTKKHYENNKDRYLNNHKKYVKTFSGRYSTLLSSAKRRGYTVEITKDQYIELRLQPCYYCGSDLEDTGICLDRIDSRKDYTLDNVVPSCRICNYLKGSTLTKEETLAARYALTCFYMIQKLPEKIIYAMSTEIAKRDRSNSRYTKLKLSAEKRGIDLRLTEKDLEKLVELPCTYCGGAIPLAGSGIDRLDSDEGYTLANCAPCCKTCNDIKGDLFSFEEAFVMINAVQKVKIYNEDGTRYCIECLTNDADRWYTNQKGGYLCPKHYRAKNYEANKEKEKEASKQYYEKHRKQLDNRTQTVRDKSNFVSEGHEEIKNKAYNQYKDIIEERNWTLITTFKEYTVQTTHKILEIKCDKDHIFKRAAERITENLTCPDCSGHSNKSSFVEKIAKKGWIYESGHYENKNSTLKARCAKGHSYIKQYRWFRDKECPQCT